MWAIVGLALLILGLRRSRALQLGGLVLFGISLAKLFLYDLAYLSSVTRAFSFVAVGMLIMVGGFFYQRMALDSRHVTLPSSQPPILHSLHNTRTRQPSHAQRPQHVTALSPPSPTPLTQHATLYTPAYALRTPQGSCAPQLSPPTEEAFLTQRTHSRTRTQHVFVR